MSEWRIIARSTRDRLGEGVLWSARDNAVYWVDILAPALNRLARLTLNPFGIEMIGDPEPHLPGNRMNDGKADRDGSIWCGTMDMMEEQDSGSFYRFDPDGRWTVLDTGYRVPNGPAFSPCGRWLYHSDTARRTVYRFTRVPGGGIKDREPFIHFTEEDGYPDGMTMDSDAHLWVAHWGGGRVSRFTPDGKLDRSIALPARQVTNICFGGADLDRMFVTSAAIGLPQSEFNGGLFEVDAGVSGPPTPFFTG